METMVRGSLKPDLEITCKDEANEVDWTVIQTSDVRVLAYMGETQLFDEAPDEVSLAEGGGGIVVRRVWSAGDTETVGRMWIEVEVSFGTGFPQVFPADGPLRLDIVPGSAGT